MSLILRNILLLVLMLAAAGVAVAMRPTFKIADQGPKVDLESMIPQTFGEWHEEKQATTQIIDPLQKEMLEKLYTQTLSRTYLDAKGNKVMLSIAYGEDQRDAVQLHYPEVCYPAQGFQILSNRKSVLDIRGQQIPVRLLETLLGQQRHEPLTYWTMIGNQPVFGGIDKKLAEMHFGLQRQIPDGLLFRVSSIDQNTEQAFAIQKQFVENLAEALEPATQLRVMGLK